MLNVITRSGVEHDVDARGYGFFRDDKFDRPPFSGRYDASRSRSSSTRRRRSTSSATAASSADRWSRTRSSTSAASSGSTLDSSEVLGISDYWRQSVADTVIPTGRAPDRRHGQGRRELQQTEPRLLPLHERLQALPERRRHVARRRGAARDARNAADLRRSAVERPRQLDDDAVSNRAFNELRVSYGVNKPWILANIAGGLGGSELLAAAGYTTTVGNPTGKFARITLSGRELRRRRRSPASRAKGNLFVVDNFSLIRGRHQFKFGGVIARQQMYMDVEAAHVGIWSFTQDKKFDANDPSSYPISVQRQHRHRRRQPRGLESVGLRRRTRGRSTGNLTLNLGARYDLDLTPTSVNQYVDAYNQRIVARLRRRGAAAASRSPTRTTCRRGSASSGCRPRIARRRCGAASGSTTTRTTGTSPTST